MIDQRYWLGFSLVSGIGAKRLKQLFNTFGTMQTAWHANKAALQQAGLENKPLENLLQKRQVLDLDAEMGRITAVGAWITTLADDTYPPLLRAIPDAPPVLYIKGELLPADQNALSVVGTRKATHYGYESAYKLAYALAKQQVTVISGLAHGIDTAAHRGALKAGGRTIAVLGCGVDTIYPADNQPLAQEITQHGALISEFPLGTPPEGRNFPRRNRIISGLALGLLVAEAPLGSGALITADLAAEQGRDVFAVPGNIFSKPSQGTNQLIQEGAKLVTGVRDILDELNLSYTRAEARTVTQQVVPDSPAEAQLLKILSAEPLHVDDLARHCHLPIAEITSTLTIMELKGLALKVGPMQYCLGST